MLFWGIGHRQPTLALASGERGLLQRPCSLRILLWRYHWIALSLGRANMGVAALVVQPTFQLAPHPRRPAGLFCVSFHQFPRPQHAFYLIGRGLDVGGLLAVIGLHQQFNGALGRRAIRRPREAVDQRLNCILEGHKLSAVVQDDRAGEVGGPGHNAIPNLVVQSALE
jgi:hypothetical protein